jgi:hypothetical protein
MTEAEMKAGRRGWEREKLAKQKESTTRFSYDRNNVIEQSDDEQANSDDPDDSDDEYADDSYDESDGESSQAEMEKAKDWTQAIPPSWDPFPEIRRHCKPDLEPTQQDSDSELAARWAASKSETEKRYSMGLATGSLHKSKGKYPRYSTERRTHQWEPFPVIERC